MLCNAIMLAFVVQGHFKELPARRTANAQDATGKLLDELVNNMMERSLKPWPFQRTDLDNATLEKGPAHLTLAQASPAALPHQIAPGLSLMRASPSHSSGSQGASSYPKWPPRLSRPTVQDVSVRFTFSPQAGLTESNSPPMMLDKECLVSGDPLVRIERAPSNAVRIFTGIDVQAPMQRVWDVLTDYENLHKVVPSLVHNEVLQNFSNGGARLAQTGSATVLPGIRFTAKMVLDVNVYYEDSPIPDSQIADHLGEKASSDDVHQFDSELPLVRGVFPRPYALTSLPHRGITMVNVVDSPGDFEHYQGVWRLQPLLGCSPSGREMSRLTYAVEIKPKGILPVKLIERRIASDLKMNIQAIRDKVEADMSREPG